MNDMPDLVARHRLLVLSPAHVPAALDQDLTDTDVIHVTFPDLDQVLVSQNAPQCIVTPLFTRQFDAQDVAGRLVSFGWRGNLIVLGGNVAASDMLAAELESQHPGLRVTVFG